MILPRKFILVHICKISVYHIPDTVTERTNLQSRHYGTLTHRSRSGASMYAYANLRIMLTSLIIWMSCVLMCIQSLASIICPVDSDLMQNSQNQEPQWM